MTDTHPTAVTRAGLAAVAGQDGTLAIVAMDQRNTLRRMLAAVSLAHRSRRTPLVQG